MDSAGHIPILDVTFVKTPSIYKNRVIVWNFYLLHC